MILRESLNTTIKTFTAVMFRKHFKKKKEDVCKKTKFDVLTMSFIERLKKALIKFGLRTWYEK